MPELMNDLNLFLRDRPIASRRTSLAVQSWRWCKRNPMMALLLNATAGLLVILAFGSFLWAQSLRRERNVARAAEVKALASEQEAVESSLASRRAERVSQEALELARRTEEQRKVLLFRTLIDEMHSAFASGSSGQRLRGLQAAEQLLAIIPWREMTADQQRELRDAAIACLSVADTELVSSTAAFGPLTTSLDVDPSLTVLATHDGKHNTQVLALDGFAHHKTLSAAENSAVFRSDRLFSICGKWLYERYLSTAHDSNWIRLWDWQSGTLVLELPNSDAENAFCFDSLGQHLYLVQGAAISVYQLPSGQRIRTSAPKFRNAQMALSADGKTLACIARNQPPCLLDSETFQIIEMLPDVPRAVSASWDPVYGDLLIGADGPDVLVWNPSRKLSHRHAVLQSDAVTSIQVDRVGHTFAIRGRGFSEIINRQRNATSIGIVGDVLRVSPSGQRFAIHRNNQVELHRLVPSNCIAETTQKYRHAKFSPDGRWLAASGAEGVRILDAQTLETVADLGLDICGPAVWNSTGDELATFGTFSHLCLWKVGTPVNTNALADTTTQPVPVEQSQATIGPPRPVQLDSRRAKLGLDNRIPQHQGRFSVWHPSGQWLYFVDYRNHTVYQMDAKTGICEALLKVDNPAGLAISPDGSRLAIEQILLDRVKLLDLDTRREITEIPHLSQPRFSCDGKYLAASRFEEVLVYSTEDWQVVHQWPGESFHRIIPIPIAMSPRSNLMAAAVSDSLVRLFDIATGETLGEMSYQRSDPIKWLEFDSQFRHLAVVRETSLSLWDLTQLSSELKSRGIQAPFFPTATSDEVPAPNNTSSDWAVERGAELLDADRWWTGYQLLAVFEAMSQNYSDAIDNMDKALAMIRHEDLQSRATALVRRAQYQLASQNAHQALNDLRQAHQMQPKEPVVIAALAKLLIEGPTEIQNIHEGELLLQQASELSSK